MSDEKLLMSEAANLYYKQGLTQQEIANLMNLSRQTVSKLLNDALKENIVEIKIHDPEKDRAFLGEAICKKFGIQNCIVCGVSNKNETLRQLMTVKAAADYIGPLLKKGNQNIALSWGRSVQAFIKQLPDMNTVGNTIFPLFGATDNENSYFSPNELTRELADKIGANAKHAWFPYLPDSREDRDMIKNLSYYQKMQQLWKSADIAILGIGNTEILEIFGKTFGYQKNRHKAIGDIATHFFTEKGEFLDLYENSLCADAEDLKAAKQTVAIACGNHKVTAIAGALRTNLIDTLITDEYTAKQILEQP